MSRANLFLDSSALFAGVVSPSGAARALLLLAEAGAITITISEQVIAETERAIARKAPRALPYYREAVRRVGVRIVHDPSIEEVQAHRHIISHPADVPIVLAAMKARADYLVTLNRRHFIDDPEVAARSGLHIGTPGDALAWVRAQLSAS
ncbi:MAG TPA: PIN domain-containing protein [Anaerolineae bacterium]|nr:PIN domain-containing protein [Anaerolineae bacterium]